MPLLSRAEAQRIVGPHFGALFNIIDGAWNEYMSDYTPKQRLTHCTTTRAGIVHDLMVEGAAKYFPTVQGANVVDSMGLKVVLLEEAGTKIAVRFKKFDNQLLPKNQPSQQVEDFRGQKQIDFLGSAFHLDAGYVLTKDQLTIQSVSLVCPNGPQNYWDIQLNKATAVTNVRDLFDTEEADDEVNIVRGKRTNDTEGDTSENEGKD